MFMWKAIKKTLLDNTHALEISTHIKHFIYIVGAYRIADGALIQPTFLS